MSDRTSLLLHQDGGPTVTFNKGRELDGELLTAPTAHQYDLVHDAVARNTLQCSRITNTG